MKMYRRYICQKKTCPIQAKCTADLPPGKTEEDLPKCLNGDEFKYKGLVP